MQLRYLKTLIAIVDYGGFALAGDAIGLTQSAVSLHMRGLETELGFKIFDRSKRPPLLTEEGQKLLPRAREIIRLSDELSNLESGRDSGGLLKLGAIPTVQTGILPTALVTLNRRLPQLQVDLSSGLSNDLAVEVFKGNIDVAIASEPAQLASGLSWHPFDAEPLVVVAPGDAQEVTDTALLESRPFIRFQRYAWAGQLIGARLKDRGIRVQCCMEVDSLEAIAQLVANGLGVSILPQRTIPQPFPADLRILPFGDTTSFRVVGLIERTGNPKAHFVKVLHEILIQACEADSTEAAQMPDTATTNKLCGL